jgi:hypothetical protein
MIRIRYSDNSVKEYQTEALAKIMVLDTLLSTAGRIIPLEAIEVMGTTISGVTVERDLKIKLGIIEFDWDR